MHGNLISAAVLGLACGCALAQQPATDKPEPPKPAAAPRSDEKKSTEPTLKLGAKAPSLKAETWVKGEPIAEFDSSHVYVIEFWATWCPSCREAMPKLAKLARANKDKLQIIAVASSERKDKNAPDERLEKVQGYVKGKDEQMPYRVVFDGSRGMATDWIVAAGQRYLPYAFVVDTTGTISWLGDPRRAEFDAAVEKALKPLVPPPTEKPAEPAKKPTRGSKPAKP